MSKGQKTKILYMFFTKLRNLNQDCLVKHHFNIRCFINSHIPMPIIGPIGLIVFIKVSSDFKILILPSIGEIDFIDIIDNLISKTRLE